MIVNRLLDVVVLATIVSSMLIIAFDNLGSLKKLRDYTVIYNLEKAHVYAPMDVKQITNFIFITLAFGFFFNHIKYVDDNTPITDLWMNGIALAMFIIYGVVMIALANKSYVNEKEILMILKLMVPFTYLIITDLLILTLTNSLPI